MSEPQHCLYPTCPTENQLVALLQGELTEDQALAIEEAVDLCPACQELMVALAQIFAPEDSPPLPSSGSTLQQIHQYHLYKELGAGGMGVVYEAFDSHLQRRVALKLLRPDVFQPDVREHHASRLLQEARLLAALHHPHIPVVYEVGTWEGQIFMVVQLIKGQDLRTWSRETAPGWDAILDVYLQIGRGLAAAHAAGIVHRDVKPDNIMIDRQGHAYITDFGLALPRQLRESLIGSSASWPPPAADAALPHIQHTEAGMVVGTPAYMAPEQRQGQECLPQTDQYAFCVSLYESLCGIAPFPDGAPSDPQATEAALYIPSSQTGIPRQIFSAIGRGLRRVPIERFTTMEALLDDLEAARRAKAASQIKRPLLIVAAICVVFLVAGSSWWLFFKDTHPSGSITTKHHTKQLRPRPPAPPLRQKGMATAPIRRLPSPAATTPQKHPTKVPLKRPNTRAKRSRKRRYRKRRTRPRTRRRQRRKRRRRRKPRRIALLSRRSIPPSPARAIDTAALGAYLARYRKALHRRQGKRCLNTYQQIKRRFALGRPTFARSLLWYKARCLMILGKCEQGGQMIAQYFRSIGGANIAFSKKHNQDQYCSISQGSWQTRLERLYTQSILAKHRRYLPLCRRLERAFDRLDRRYHSQLMATVQWRYKLITSIHSIAECYYQKPVCSKVEKIWWRGKELSNPRGLSPFDRRYAEGLYRRTFPKCPLTPTR